MEGSCMLETPVLLLENFEEESQMLYQSFRTSGFDGPVFTFSDYNNMYTYKIILVFIRIIVVKKKEEKLAISIKLMYRIIGKSRRVIQVVKSLI